MTILNKNKKENKLKLNFSLPLRIANSINKREKVALKKLRFKRHLA